MSVVVVLFCFYLHAVYKAIKRGTHIPIIGTHFCILPFPNLRPSSRMSQNVECRDLLLKNSRGWLLQMLNNIYDWKIRMCTVKNWVCLSDRLCAFDVKWNDGHLSWVFHYDHNLHWSDCRHSQKDSLLMWGCAWSAIWLGQQLWMWNMVHIYSGQ